MGLFFTNNRALTLTAVAVTVACSSKSDPPASNTPDTGVDPLVALPGEGPAPKNVAMAPACGDINDAALKFERKTEDWGLKEVRGTHLSAVDLDRDGYPDLLVTSGGSARSEVGAKQITRLMMNRPRAGGGRQFVEET